MKAKKGYKQQKSRSPWIGKWLKWYFTKKTCRKTYNKEMERLCLEAFDNGERTTLQQVIDELKKEINERPI